MVLLKNVYNQFEYKCLVKGKKYDKHCMFNDSPTIRRVYKYNNLHSITIIFCSLQLPM